MVRLMLEMAMARWMSEEEMVRGGDGAHGRIGDLRGYVLPPHRPPPPLHPTLHHTTKFNLHTFNSQTSTLHTPSVSQLHSGVSQCMHADNHGARHTHPITDAPGLRDACATDFWDTTGA